jgi:hypothetical protein
MTKPPTGHRQQREPHESSAVIRLPNSKEAKMAGKRELIEPHKGDKRFVRRDDQGRFNESDDVGKSLAQDVRRKAKTVARKGQGDRGDRKVM